MKHITINGSLNFFVILTSIILFCFFASRLFWGSFLWYDEAGQFYIAKGLFHYSDPFTPYSNLSDVLFYNRYFNKDPGGFGVLLHYWSMISNHYIWLRLLPLLFYCCMLLLSFLLFKKQVYSTVLAVLLTSIFLVHPVFSIEACEIRAYSMEMLGVMLSLFVITQYRSLSYKIVLLLAVIIALFMTSRYSFVVYASAFSIYFAYLLYQNEGLKKFLNKLFLYGGIVLLSLFLIWYLSFQYQFTPQGQGYVEGGYLGRNPMALFSLPCIRFYILLAIAYYKYKRDRVVDNYLSLAIVVSAVFIFFSGLNLHPIDERRSMSLSVIQYYAICLGLVKMLGNSFQAIAKFMFLLVSLSLVFIFPKLNKYRHDGDCAMREYTSIVKELNNKKIYVHRYFSPSVKYLMEEGELSGLNKDIYLNHVYLAKEGTHSPCEYLHYEIIKPEDYKADYYLIQDAKYLRFVDKNIFKLYNGYKNIYEKK